MTTKRAAMNTLFPGRPDYTGPTEGWFGLLHHNLMYEYSHNVMERVRYVQRKKPKHEIAVRLHNMIYLGPELGTKCTVLKADYEAKLKLLDDDYLTTRKPLNDDYDAKRKPLDDDYWTKLKLLNEDFWAKRKLLDVEILAYIKHHIPDCAWNGTELAFPSASKAQP